MTPEYSIVIPVLNECETLEALYQRITPVMDALDGSCEVILVDDGSTDGSAEIMRGLHERDDRFTVVRLSRNFGHQVAISAGLDHAHGNAVIVMDADLQDPPEVALELAKKWREGFDVVYAVRDDRAGESRTRARDHGPLLPVHVSPQRGTDPGRHRRLPPRRPARRSMRCARCPNTAVTCAACSPGSATTRPACTTSATRVTRG